MSKICNKCGKTLDDNVNYCPYCKSDSFRINYAVSKPNDDMAHKLLYWSYPEGSMLSKSKIAGLGVFIFFTLFWASTGYFLIGILLAALFGAITFLIGFVAHKIIGNPASKKIQNNDYGLLEDFKYLLFYWQDRNGGYVISKTKCISIAVFMLMFVVGLMSPLNSPIILLAIMFALLFGVPVFAVGFIIHKLIFKDTDEHMIPTRTEKPKKIKTQEKIPLQKNKVIPEYLDYQLQLDELNKKFRLKDKSARELIEKRFEPPQLTYTRFIGGVDKSAQLFDKTLNSAHTMISLADEYSPRIAKEIEAKINILTSIIEKLDGLSNELILNEDLSKKEDVDDLISEMDDLIGSVKDYDIK